MNQNISMAYDRFYTYDELTRFLQDACAAHPELTELESIGKSFENRDLWAVTVTNFDTGPAEDKPAMYIDANIHAGEVTGCAVCMYTLQYLLNNYGKDDRVTELLDTRAFYILPRVNPDGAELYLTSTDMLRSSVRPNPDFELKDNHLYAEDVTGDGEILTMRVRDPNGTHKVSDKDPRLMLPRKPDDIGGVYYNLLPEGTIHNYDGGAIEIGPRKWDLDINRNFPADWKPTQAGGGRYPLSEPETRAMVEFILNHKNIATVQAYHTFAGIILRPSCTRPDDQLDKDDIRAFESIGELGTQTTDYPVKSVYHGFTRDKGTARQGVFIDWVYENLGLLGYTTELWDKYGRAGITREDMTFGKPVPEEQMLKLFAWHDEEELDAFVPWEEVDHPQLGTVEVGGFRQKTFQQNTHFKFLEDECHKNTIFSLQQALATPCLALLETQVSEVEPGLLKITADVMNTGYLSTNITAHALKIGSVKPVEVVLEGEGLTVLDGDARRELGQLDGYMKAADGYYMAPPSNLKRVQWLVKKGSASSATVTVRSERAGTVKTTVDL